ncbi:MAG: helix-turn-helix transcriptional regulator [Saprospiraceae bacterium]|nr:helix-turn-helix transcriptional regulator [Saprospiraceae bacterium]MBK6817448.1 helix-turn-helix transcriptional regulator [Saprospiraceae bacterium]
MPNSTSESPKMRVQIDTLPNSIILNEKQMLVLFKLLNGKAYKSIAKEMGISIAAVRQYAHRIYKKLKVVNKTEAIIKYAIRSDNKSYLPTK